MMEIPEVIKKCGEFFEHINVEARMGIADTVVEIGFMEVARFDGDLANELHDRASEILKCFEIALEEKMDRDQKKFRVRIKKLLKSDKVLIRAIRGETHYEKLVELEGRVKTKSKVRQKIVKARYECPACGNLISVLVLDEKVKQPTMCGCGRKGRFTLLVDALEKTNCFVISLQEPEDMVNIGSDLQTLTCIFTDDLCLFEKEQQIYQGCRVRLNGIVKQVLVRDRDGNIKAVVDHYFEVNHVEEIEGDFSNVVIKPKDIEKIKELAEDDECLMKLSRSIFGPIHGFENVKQSLILSMVGGNTFVDKKLKNRGLIHVLLIGDPGAGKTDLMLLLVKCHPKAMYINVAGGSTSAVGINSSVVKDELTQEWTFSAGAIPMMHKGILAVDEINEMPDPQAMQESLEQMCYDDKTEILTEKGWKLFKKLSKEDKVASLNKKGELYYVKPSQYITSPYKGKMIHINSRKKVDLLVSPNHNLWTSLSLGANKWGKFSLHRADTIMNKKMKFKKDAKWRARSKPLMCIPSIEQHKNQNASFQTDIIKIEMGLWLEFFGYFLEEGSVQKSKGTPYRVHITQTKEEVKIQKIENCVSKLGFNWSYDGHNFSINNKQLATYLSKFGKSYQKFIPSEIKALCSEQLNILYKAMMLGDGCDRTKTKQGNYYFTSSKKLADDFQEILLKLGKSGNIKIIDYRGKEALNGIGRHLHYVISITEHNETQVCSNGYKQFKKENYDGKIYCVEVPNHLLYVRRNGKPVWCGNTVTVAKANIQAKLKAETTIIASCNPKMGRFDPFQNIYEQIDMPPQLVNRFDLIFPFKDIRNADRDGMIAASILGRHKENKEEEVQEIDTDLIKKWIIHAQQYKPTMPDDVCEYMKSKYVEIRNKVSAAQDNDQSYKPVPISPRQLQAMIRVAQALSKLRLKNKVNKERAKFAVELVISSLELIGVDPETGEIDIQTIEGGLAASKKSKMRAVRDIIFAVEGDNLIEYSEILKKAEEKGVTESELDELLAKLIQISEIFEPRRSFYKKL